MNHRQHAHHSLSHGHGPGGFCVCPKCGHRQEHRAGVPCREERCPHCGTTLLREGSAHHEQIKEKT